MAQVDLGGEAFRSRNTFILSLSDEVLIMIFRSLSSEDKIILSASCRRFDNVLLEKRLCRDVSMAPEHDGSCLRQIGSYFKKRRQLITSVDINSCAWIPMPKIVLMTKNLVNLNSLHVLNVCVPVPILAGILKGTKKLRELSWSWQYCFKAEEVAWSDIPPEERMALSGLEYFHVCLSNPWCPAALELLEYCSDLVYLAVQVDPYLGKLPIPKVKKETNFCGPKKLKSIIIFKNFYGGLTREDIHLEVSMGRLMRQLWASSGGCSGAWECLWTNAYWEIPWTNETFNQNFKLIWTQLRSIVLRSPDFARIHDELPILQLAIIHTSPSVVSLPPLNSVAPKLQQLSFITNIYCEANNMWIISSLQSSKYLSEINLTGVHYCMASNHLGSFWLALRNLESMKKLCVAPCILPKIVKTPSPSFDVDNFTINPQLNVISEAPSELLSLNSLEEFEIGNCITGDLQLDNERFLCSHGSWIPFIQGISLWTKLQRLTMTSISSLRSLQQFKMVTSNCRDLSHLHLQDLGPLGHCSYAKDIAVALPHCQKLKHFRLEQPHISEFVKDLLVALSSCSQLESIFISNRNHINKISLKKKENFQPILLKLLTSCPNLTFLIAALPDVCAESCKKLKKLIEYRMKHKNDNQHNSIPVLEFCSNLKLSSSCINKFHDLLPKCPQDYVVLEKLRQLPVATVPPLRRLYDNM